MLDKNMPKKTKITIAIIGILAAAIALALIFIFLMPTSIGLCKNDWCLKRFIASEQFNPAECQNAAENLKNNCYYLYATEKSEAGQKDAGEQCSAITNIELKADCFYKTWSTVIVSPKTREIFFKAADSLDAKICDQISIAPLKEGCAKGVELTKRAIAEGKPELCLGETEDIHIYMRQTCQQVSTNKISAQ